MKVEVSTTEISVTVPFEEKARVKALRGGRWNASTKTWRFPATPHAAQRLIEAFPELEFIELPCHAGYDEPPASALLVPRFKTKLWEHQQRAVQSCIYRPASMLAMEMRTGKTAVALALASIWNCKRILVSCPLSVVGVWQSEVALHTSNEWTFARLDKGGVVEKTKMMQDARDYADLRKLPLIVVVNHESLWREPFGAAALGFDWDLVIIDESHRSKSPGGKLSRYLAKMGEVVPRRLALTGTPIVLNPLDAYAQYRFLDRSIFGTSFSRMRNHFCIMGGYRNHEIKSWQNMDEFSALFHEIAFEVTTAEAFDLPDEMDIRRSTRLEPKAQKIYDSLEKHFWADVDKKEITAANALVKLLRLSQICCGWVNVDEAGGREMVQVSTAKTDLLQDVLEDFAVETPLVIFVRFTKDIEMIREVCLTQGRRVGEISGQRKDMTDDGKFPQDLDVMVCQIQSGSLGIDLSRASTCIFYSWGWSLGDVEQARARIRHGEKTEKLSFIHLVIEDSIDDRMMTCLKTRSDFIEDVLSKGRPHAW